MGASTSARRDGKSQEDAPTEEQNEEVKETQEMEDADAKLLQKNGQISSLNGKAEDQAAEICGVLGDEKVLAEVGQTDSVSVSQKEDSPELMDVLQDEVAPQMNGEKEEKDSTAADELSSADKVEVEEKASEDNEVGFKKIFRFVGFKFTLKKDKNEKVEPVQLLTVKKEEGEASSSEVVEDSKEEDATPAAEEKLPEEPEMKEEMVAECAAPKEESNEGAAEQAVEEPGAIQEVTQEKESELAEEPQASPAVQATQSPLRRFFTQGIFSNLRKRTSFKKAKEEELSKEKTAEDEIKETEETQESPVEDGETTVEEAASESPEEQQVTHEETKPELSTEAVPAVEVAQKEDEIPVKVEAELSQTASEEVKEVLPAETDGDIKSAEEKVDGAIEGQTSPDEVITAITTEVELLSSQEKVKTQGSPLKKILTGTGLKKLSAKRQKGKKEPETKLTESGELAAEQLTSSTESAEGQKGESSPSSPEESAEHGVGEFGQALAGQESEGEAVTSDGEKKKDGILPWASFKKLVTPKKRVKRSSESEDEMAEKPKSATLSSTDSAVFAEKQEEAKPSEEEQKTESTEEPKKKMDTSVSWEALICVGSAKKRARKTSDSDDEATRIEEEAQQSGEEYAKTAESPLGNSHEADQENVVSSTEQAGSPSEADGVSTWESLKRLVTPRRKTKPEERVEESTGVSATDQTTSDSEVPKEESSFSLKKLIPGRRKKKSEGRHEQVSSDEAGKDVASGEEDSDTPAVVPLSEYESPEADRADVTLKEIAVAADKPADAAEGVADTPKATKLPLAEEQAQAKVVTGAEERSPSWISPTAVEDIQETTECITKKQLSDIPEEGDTIATPKSAAEEVSRDDTIAEDIVELTSEAVTAVEQVPEVSFTEETTEMVSAVSRLTESPGTSGETTPVQAEYDMEKTEAILQEVVETISLTKNAVSMTVADMQPEAVAVSISSQLVESATQEEKVILVLHQKSEATAICTGLDAQDIEFLEEKPLKTSFESVTETSEAISTEIVFEGKTEKPEEAVVAGDKIYAAQVQEIESEFREAEPIDEVVEVSIEVEVEAQAVQVNDVQENDILLLGEVKDAPVAELPNEIQDVKPIHVATANLVHGASELLEEPLVVENIQKLESEGPLETTTEECNYVQSAQVTEVSPVEGDKLEELEAVQKDSADVELAPVEEVVEFVTQEVTVSIPQISTAETTETVEAPIGVLAPATEFPVATETVCIINAVSESVQSETVEIKDEAVMERVPSVRFLDNYEIQVEVKDTDIPAAESIFKAEIEAAPTSVSAVIEETCEKIEEVEVLQPEPVEEAEMIELQGAALVQEVIQNVVENLSEVGKESETVKSQELKETDILLQEPANVDGVTPTIEVGDEKVPDSEVPAVPGCAEGQVETLAAAEEATRPGPVETEEIKEKSEVSEVLEEAEKPPEPALEAVPVEGPDSVPLEVAGGVEVAEVVHSEEIPAEACEPEKQETEVEMTAEEVEVQDECVDASKESTEEGTQESMQREGEEKIERQEVTDKTETVEVPVKAIHREVMSKADDSVIQTESQDQGEIAQTALLLGDSQVPDSVLHTEKETVEEVQPENVQSEPEVVADSQRQAEVKAEQNVQETVTEAMTEQEPVAKTEQEPVAITEEEPVAKTEQEPVAITEQEPVAKTEQELMVKTEQEPVAITEQEPVAKTEQEQVAITEQEPVAITEQEPVAKTEQEPVAKTEQEPVAKTEQEPLSKTEQEPVSKTEQEPVSKTEQEPVAKTEQEPVAKTEQEPVSKTEQEPVSKTEQEPVAKTELDSVSKTELDSVSKTEQEPVSKTEQEPVAKTEQEPVAKTEQEPVSKTEQEPVSKTEQEPVAKTELDSVSKTELDSVSKTEQEPVSKTEQEPVAKTEQEPVAITQPESDHSQIHTEATEVIVEQNIQNETTEEVHIQTTLAVVEQAVVNSQEVVMIADQCQSVEEIHIETAVEFAVVTEKVSTEDGMAQDVTETNTKDDAASSICQTPEAITNEKLEAEIQQRMPSPEETGSEMMEKPDTMGQEPLPEDLKTQESLAGEVAGPAPSVTGESSEKTQTSAPVDREAEETSAAETATNAVESVKETERVEPSVNVAAVEPSVNAAAVDQTIQEAVNPAEAVSSVLSATS